jgi:hypothetical protein
MFIWKECKQGVENLLAFSRRAVSGVERGEEMNVQMVGVDSGVSSSMLSDSSTRLGEERWVRKGIRKASERDLLKVIFRERREELFNARAKRVAVSSFEVRKF